MLERNFKMLESFQYLNSCTFEGGKVNTEEKNATNAIMVKKIYYISFPLRHNFNSIISFFIHKNISIMKFEVLKTGSVKSCPSYALFFVCCYLFLTFYYEIILHL